jgi:hypothetical protein
VASPSGIRPEVADTPPPGAVPDADNCGRQLEFLYKSLDDNQNVIRFLDAKAAFAIVLLSAMAGKILSNLTDYFPNPEEPFWHWDSLLFYAFSAMLLVAGSIFVRVIFPASNPSANCQLSPESSTPFFLFELKPRRFRRIFTSNPQFSRLAQNHEAYLEQICAADSEALLRAVSAEVLKVCYIRQIKTDRLKGLAHASAACAFLFVVLMVAAARVPRASRPQIVEIKGPVLLHPAVPATPLVQLPEHPVAPATPRPSTKRRTQRP